MREVVLLDPRMLHSVHFHPSLSPRPHSDISEDLVLRLVIYSQLWANAKHKYMVHVASAEFSTEFAKGLRSFLRPQISKITAKGKVDLAGEPHATSMNTVQEMELIA